VVVSIGSSFMVCNQRIPDRATERCSRGPV